MARRRKAGTDTVIAAAWRASRPGLSAVILFSAFVNLLKFSMPLYLLQVLDRIPVSRSVETLIMLTVIALVAVASGLALDIVRRRMLTRWSVWIERRFGPKLVEDGLSAASLNPSSDVVQSLGDLGRLRTFVSQHAASWLDVVWAPLFVLGVYLIHPLLGALVVGAIVILIALGALQVRMTREARRVSNDAAREADRLLLEAERHRESVGALSMGPNLTEKWCQASSGRLSERERIEARQALFQTLIRGLGQFLRIAMIAVGVWLVITQSFTIGGIFAARVMAGFGYTLVERAMRNWRSLLDAKSAYASLKQQLRQSDELPPSLLPGVKEAPLVLEGVSFRYPGQGRDVFRRLSFVLERGELLLITGGAGTGKSTLSRLLIGLSPPRAGWVRFGDFDLTRLPLDVRADLIGYLPQHTELLGGTVRENIARMGKGSIDEVVEAAKLVGIHDVIIGLPNGYDTPISSATVGLSGSERKRIALARAIFNRPRLIVLDEPSANLDSPSRRIVEAALKQLKSQGSSIIATQAIQSAQMGRIADKLLNLGGATPELIRADSQGSRKPRGSANLWSVK